MVDIPYDPPYLYDDPRLIYDEPCLFYDGGFSVQCLINLQGRIVGLPRKVGRSTAFYTLPKKEKECRTVLDIKIEVALSKINNKEIEKKPIVKKYHLDYGPITVSVGKAKHKEQNLSIHMQAITSSMTIPKICITDKKIKLLPIRTIVSSSLSRIKKPKVIFKTDPWKKK